MEPIKILIADDHPVVREDLSAMPSCPTRLKPRRLYLSVS